MDPDWEHKLETAVRSVLPQLDPHTPLADDRDLRMLGLDSMAVVELILRLEEICEVTLPDEALSLSAFSSLHGIRAVVSAALEHADGPVS